MVSKTRAGYHDGRNEGKGTAEQRFYSSGLVRGGHSHQRSATAVAGDDGSAHLAVGVEDATIC